MLVDAGANVEARAYFDMTPLHWAALLGRHHAMDRLIARGANIEATTFYGMTPLHLAATPQAIKILLAAGAKVDARDHHGMTPLHFVRSEGGAMALLNAGANPTARAQNGRRPIDMVAAVNAGTPRLFVFPDNGVVRLRGDSAVAGIQVVNVSAESMAEVRVTATSSIVDTTVEPGALRPLYPAQFATLRVHVRRRPEKAPGEYALRLVLDSEEPAALVQTDLRLDTRTQETPEDRGMLRVGQVTARAAPPRWQYLVYGLAPIALMVIFLLSRRSNGHRASGHDEERR